jgi:sporulation protein YqfD
MALSRPVLLLGLLVFIIVTMYLPSRVLFFEVEGNVTVPTKLILEKCQQCGISFGVSRSEVRSEKMKNALLDAIPQLQWAGINTSGCTAVISVRERSEAIVTEEEHTVSSIVASRDGIITQCTATRGNLLCKPGQAVMAGAVLISGYTDCGICIRANSAEGEVFAKTERNLSVISPSIWTQKKEKTVTAKKFAVIIGKKRINFYKDSGILDTSCDKMYSESYVTLPGGFRVPVILVTEVYTYRQSVQTQIEEPTLSKFAQNYLQQQMVSGTILSMNETVQLMESAYYLKGKYICTEMIGRIRNEEIIKPYE